MKRKKAKHATRSHIQTALTLFCAELLFSFAVVFIGLTLLQPPILEPVYTLAAGIALWLFWPLVCAALICFLLVPNYKLKGAMRPARSAMLSGLALTIISTSSLMMLVVGFK